MEEREALDPWELTEDSYVSPKKAWENLANAVVAQAAEDYRAASKVLRRHPNNNDANYIFWHAVNFFRSKYFSFFTQIPGEEILRLLEKEQEEIEKNERERISRAVPEEDGPDRSPAGQDRRNTRVRRKVHFRSQPHTRR